MGLLLQVPWASVSVWPCVVVPVIVGGEDSTGGGRVAAGTVIVIAAVADGVPGTPGALSVTAYTFVVVLVFAGTVIVPVPLQLATEGSESAAAVVGDDVALMLQLFALVVAKDAFTVPPPLDGIVVDFGVNDVIAAVGPT